MTALWLTRARLRQDVNLAALAPVLLPEDADVRAGMAHRLVWTLFADSPDRLRDFLWRENKHGEFMLLSARLPDAGALFTLEVKPFAPVLDLGDRLHFMLRANPTLAHAVPGRERRSPRSDVVMAALKQIPQGEERQQARPRLIQEAGTAWLRQKGERSGFRPTAAQVDGYDQRRIPRARKAPITLSTLDFEGILTVTSPAVFLAALASGFGRARAFGCGLMLIRRAA